KVTVGDCQIWRIGCQRLAALCEVARRNERRQAERCDPIKPVPVLAECVERCCAYGDCECGDRNEGAEQPERHPKANLGSRARRQGIVPILVVRDWGELDSRRKGTTRSGHLRGAWH